MQTDTDRTYTASIEDLTVYASNGVETWDLNADGEPIADTAELRDFIDTLHEQGFYGADVRDELRASVGLTAGLIAETLHDSIVVRDPEGGVWWPSDEARREIEAAADPHARAIEIADAEPMRGEWRQ